MIKRLEQLLTRLSNNAPQPRADDIHLASAALLVEVATIDQEFDESEWRQLQQILKKQCGISAKEVETMMKDAQQASEQSSSLYDFTQQINRHFSAEEKFTLTKSLWAIAYADGNIDKYEEHIIRRITDLIHVNHSDFIKAKLAVRDPEG